MKLQDLIAFSSLIEVMDIGAACIAEVPVYKRLIDAGLARLNAFEGDARHVHKIRETYGESARVFPQFLGDGRQHTLYQARELTGMTSLLRPDRKALRFFNGFENFGQIEREVPVQTTRLDDVAEIGMVDFLKMDIQGSELEVLKYGKEKLSRAVFIQLEVSFIALYENQPTLGDIDVWMRAQGFVPHCFLDVKRWSIAPTVREGDFRMPFNQLLEADLVYMKDPLRPNRLDREQLQKMALIAHHCLGSVDLCVHALMELGNRGAVPKDTFQRYLQSLSAPAVPPLA